MAASTWPEALHRAPAGMQQVYEMMLSPGLLAAVADLPLERWARCPLMGEHLVWDDDVLEAIRAAVQLCDWALEVSHTQTHSLVLPVVVRWGCLHAIESSICYDTVF